MCGFWKKGELDQIKKEAVEHAKQKKLQDQKRQLEKEETRKEREFQVRLAEYSSKDQNYAIGSSGFTRFLKFIEKLSLARARLDPIDINAELKRFNLEELKPFFDNMLKPRVEKPKKE